MEQQEQQEQQQQQTPIAEAAIYGNWPTLILETYYWEKKLR